MLGKSFFSISYDLIVSEGRAPYDLYVNSSSIEKKQKFIKIYPEGEFLTKKDLENFKEKYLQLYVEESQRKKYMRSLTELGGGQEAAANFIKDSTVQYLQKIFDDEKEFTTEILEVTIGECRFAVESMVDVLGSYDINSITGLIGGLSTHDFYTFDHSINVSMYCISILKGLKPTATREELVHIGLGGLLHDLGKIKIPTNILNSPEGLTSDEYEIIKQHPTYGIDLLTSGSVKVADDLDLGIIGRVVHEHHENWDGNGYPNKIKEKEIHLYARICTIADFFDAITTKRSYSDVLTISQALGVMGKFSGVKLDPNLFKAFAAHVEHHKIESRDDLKLADSFDPTIPYEKLPLEEIEKMFEEENFGKIRLSDN